MVTITVPWKNQSNLWWTDTCAKIIEHFGLPGNKYKTEVSAECMHFYFENKQDALLCQIMISDQI